MITPKFSFNQEDDFLTIEIRAPGGSLKDLEILVQEDFFLFFYKPYYLRLKLPGCLENKPAKSEYDSDLGVFTFTYKKSISGEHFEDLELISKFLLPNNTEKINQSTVLIEDESQCSDSCTFEMFGTQLLSRVSHGQFEQVIKVDPRIVIEERTRLRILDEAKKFDAEHYMCNYLEKEEILELTQLEPPWKDLKDEYVDFTSEDLNFLKNLHKSFTLSESQKRLCHHFLLDVLFAYCYDQRTTHFERTCESGWTITELASSLSWFSIFSTPKEVLISSFRRSLIYPLYRNFELSSKVKEDLTQILALGEKYTIKCLIDIYYIFLGGGDNRYILNELFITNFIVYVDKYCDKKIWEEYITKINSIAIEKDELGLGLKSLEESFTPTPNYNAIDLDSSPHSADDSIDSEDSSTDSENVITNIKKTVDSDSDISNQMKTLKINGTEIS